MKKIVLGLVMTVLMLALTGCVQSDYHVTINKDKSGQLAYKMGLSKAIVDMAAQESSEDPLKSMTDEYKKRGFAIKKYKTSEYVGIIATQNVKDMTKLAKIGLDDPTVTQGLANDGTFQYTTKKGFLFDTVKVAAAFDMTSKSAIQAAKKLAEETGEDFDVEQYGQQMDAAFAMYGKSMDLSFTLTLPGKASKHNASKTAANNTYIWKLKLGKLNKINVEAKVPNTGNIAIVVGAAVVVLGGAFVLFRRRKGGAPVEDAEEAATEAPTTEAPVADAELK